MLNTAQTDTIFLPMPRPSKLPLLCFLFRPSLDQTQLNIPRLAFLLLLPLLFSLTGCETFQTKPEVVVEPTPEPEPVVVLPSSEPISKPSDRDIRFAQTSLKKLGFKIGWVDGIWGPRSAKAIRSFEQDNQLKSANGRLSELNLSYLEQVTKIDRNDIQKPKLPRKSTLAAKLDKSIPLEEAPQLVMIDRPYSLMAKPNVIAERLDTLKIGTGVYVIRLLDGWYEVESENRQRGYIEDN